jgi:hypothetical protein
MSTFADWSPYLLAFLTTVLIPSAGYLVSTSISVKSKLKVHEATDAVRFDNIQTALDDLKQAQTESRTEIGVKLDRLLERKHA